MAETTQKVKHKESTACAENPRAVVGHNQPSLSEAAQANLQTGILLLCKEALITAIQDRRLQRPHLRVLAAIATCINARTAKAWPDRAAIAAMAGLSLKSVSNTILELRGWSYLISDRETVEEAGGRSLTVYTFGNVDHDEIRRQITDVILKMREQRKDDSSRPRVTRVPAPGGTSAGPEFPPQGELPAPTGTGVPPQRELSSRPGGDSNSKDNNNIPLTPSKPAPKGKPRTNLPEDWRPAVATITWAKENFVVTDQQVADEAEKFHNHHFSKGSKMADWPAAWRNWWLNGYHKHPRRRKASSSDSAFLPFGSSTVDDRKAADELAAACERILAEEDAERCRR